LAGNSYIWSGNAKGGSITALSTSCLTGLELAVWQQTIFVFICKKDKSKQVKQEVNCTVILPPLVFLDLMARPGLHHRVGHGRVLRSGRFLPGTNTGLFCFGVSDKEKKRDDAETRSPRSVTGHRPTTTSICFADYRKGSKTFCRSNARSIRSSVSSNFSSTSFWCQWFVKLLVIFNDSVAHWSQYFVLGNFRPGPNIIKLFKSVMFVKRGISA